MAQATPRFAAGINVNRTPAGSAAVCRCFLQREAVDFAAAVAFGAGFTPSGHALIGALLRWRRALGTNKRVTE